MLSPGEVPPKSPRILSSAADQLTFFFSMVAPPSGAVGSRRRSLSGLSPSSGMNGVADRGFSPAHPRIGSCVSVELCTDAGEPGEAADR